MGSVRKRMPSMNVFTCRHCLALSGGDEIAYRNRWCSSCGKFGPDAPEPADLLWLAKDGTVYRLGDMESRHIQYSVNMILNREGWRNHYMEPLLLVLKERKEREKAT